MKKIVVNFWAWSNICTDSQRGIINGFNRSCGHYGHAFNTLEGYRFGADENPYNNLYYFVGEPIAETDKAICFSVPCYTFNSRCDITRTYYWKLWMPKKCIQEGNFFYKEWAS